MNNRRFSKAAFACVLAGLGLAFVAGCSNGGGSLPHTSASSTTVQGKGAVQITIHWPQLLPPSKLIPLAAKSISLTLSSGTSTVASKTVSRPTTGNTTTITLPDIPAGTYTETATAYPNTDATGTAQSQGAQTITVPKDQTVTTPDLTMNSTIKAVELTYSASTVAAGSPAQTLTATAKNAQDQVVLTAPSNFQWTADNPTLATFTPNGSTATLTPLAAGTVHVSVKETESGLASGTVAFTITAGSGGTGGGGGTGTDKSKIFVVDSGNSRLVGLDTIPATAFASFPLSAGSVATDTQGHIYFTSGVKIYRIDDITGANLVTYTHPNNTYYVTLDKQGRIYFYSDLYTLNRMDDMNGTNLVTYNPTNQFGQHLLNGTSGVAVDSQNRIYVTLSLSGTVMRFDDMTGANATSFGTKGNGVNQFKSPAQVAVDSSNRIYVADAGNHRVIRFDDMNGTNWVAFAIPSTVSNTANFEGVAVDRSATPQIYFTDALNGVVYRMNDMSGGGLVQYGANGTGNGQFNFPDNLAVK